ncbi:MAG: hypothetical protein AB1411_11945 [Nitrospirota bacterium]
MGRPRSRRAVRQAGGILPALAVLFGAGLTGCAGVDTMRLTNATFPPKASVEEVEVLDQVPKCPHAQLAELSMDDDSSGFGTMQNKILRKAAELGADAVIFARPEKQVEHQVAYQTAYSPWGFGGWTYGPYGYGTGYETFSMGYGVGGPYPGMWPGYGGMAVPYDVTVKSLRGLAIKYTGSGGPRC